MINLTSTELFTKNTRAHHKTVRGLEDIGFICKTNEEDSSSLCLNSEKQLMFSINDESRIDSDGDTVPDLMDCDPYDPSRQDFDTPTLHPIDRDEKRTLRGYNLDDYYFSNGNWVLRPDAKPVKKRWWKG